MLECPLGSQGRDGIETVVQSVGRPYQALGEFHFGTQAELEIIVHTVEGIEVEPELGFAAQHQVALHAIVVPKVGITAEAAQALGKMDTHTVVTCQLCLLLEGWLARYL